VSRAAAELARFSADFAVPFLRGGTCAAGKPLGYDGWLAVRHGLGVDAALADACTEQVGQAFLWGDVAPATFDVEAAALLYAVHDLFCATHPDSARFYANAQKFCAAALVEVQRLPATLDAHRLMQRHVVVRRAFMATRRDVDVRWWTGSAQFFGEEVPGRLVKWPSLRNVRQQESHVPMWQLALMHGDEHVRMARQTLWKALLDASPLTRLLWLTHPAQATHPFSLAMPQTIDDKRVSVLDALEDRRLARLVTDAWLDEGFDAPGSALALALLQGLRQGVPPRMLRRAAELCTHLVLTAALVESAAPGDKAAAPLRDFLDKDGSKLTEGQRIFWAVVGSTLALSQRGHFQLPAMDDAPSVMKQLLQRLAKKVAQPRILVVAEPLLRELARRLTRLQSDPRADAQPTEPAAIDPTLAAQLDAVAQPPDDSMNPATTS
jgi:hypothetical protein